MLAKWWKKVLLAICIIACIFNLMSKLVNRHSLKENLESVNDGIVVFNIFQKKNDVRVIEESDVIDGVNVKEKDENKTITENVKIEKEQVVENELTQEEIIEEEIVEEQVEENEDESTMTFKTDNWDKFFDKLF